MILRGKLLPDTNTKFFFSKFYHLDTLWGVQNLRRERGTVRDILGCSGAVQSTVTASMHAG